VLQIIIQKFIQKYVTNFSSLPLSSFSLVDSQTSYTEILYRCCTAITLLWYNLH